MIEGHRSVKTLSLSPRVPSDLQQTEGTLGCEQGHERSTCKVGAWCKGVLDRSVTGRDGCAVWVREAARRTGCTET